jgi:NTE family protein
MSWDKITALYRMTMSNDVPKKQRALVLQGGGALGAYEAGVFKALCEKITREDSENGEEDRLLFDIIAGTSAGAINGSILVSYVTKRMRENPNWSMKQFWEGSAQYLEEFWSTISSTPYISQWFNLWWNYWFGWLPNSASQEAARRYYAAKEFLIRGAQGVFSNPQITFDTTYFDPQNFWAHYDNQQLKDNIRLFAKLLPLRTYFESEHSRFPEPRLLIASVDIQEGETVIFDSYEKQTGNWKSVYGRQGKEYDKKGVSEDAYEHVIPYDKGIDIEHIMASLSVPLHYTHTELRAQERTNYDPVRRFWDGQLLSNTPLRELISEHKKFWENQIKTKTKTETKKLFEIKAEQFSEILWQGKNNEITVPSLEVYIVNLWPTKEREFPKYNRDLLSDRKNDITSHDKTEYDRKVAMLVTDYTDLAQMLIQKIIDLAKKNGVAKEAIADILKEILEERARTSQRTGEQRKYLDLIKARFEITKTVIIERVDDEDSVSNKWLDLSRLTIDQMIRQGYREAQMPVDLEFISDKVNRLLAKRKITETHGGELHQRIQKIKLDLKHQDRLNITKNLVELLGYAKREKLPSVLIDRIEELR